MKKLLLFTSLLSAYASFGQGLGGLQRNISEFNSPQVSSMLRFDETPVDLYAGRFNLEIPLIDFQDRDFTFPISLRYNSAGFKPNEPDNFVGLNWSLQPVCAIYRIVKQMPDDHPYANREVASWHESFTGFLAIRDHPTNVRKEQVFYDPAIYVPMGEMLFPRIKSSQVNGRWIEASSDIYKFNVDGYSGHFMIDFDGSVRVVSENGGIVKVDIGQYRMMPESMSPTNNSKIILRGDNGYTYVFGGSYSAMEYNAGSWTLDYYAQYPAPLPAPGTTYLERPAVTAFLLTEIIAPNGRVMMIEYDKTIDNQYSELHRHPYNVFKWYNEYNQFPQELQKCYQVKINHYTNNYVFGVNGGVPFVDGETGIFTHPLTNTNYSINKIAIIKCIRTDGKEITFHYSPRTVNKLKDGALLQRIGFTACTDKLDSITFYGYGAPSQVAKLQYYDNGRLFLDRVENSTKGNYEFTYADRKYISPAIINVDRWGFSRGETVSRVVMESTKLYERYPPHYETSYEVSEIISDHRAAITSGFETNMLESVTFPTGGRVQYTYEMHDYGRRLYRGPNTSYVPITRFESQTQKAGGTRIKNIKYYDGNEPVKQVNYLYKSTVDSELSSGFLLNYPRYAISVRMPDEEGLFHGDIYTRWFRGAIFDSNGYDNMCADNDHIGYASVIEINAITEGMPDTPATWVTKNGYKLTRFNDYESNPDCDGRYTSSDKVYKTDLPTMSAYFDNPLSPFYIYDYHVQKNLFRDFGDRSQERGKIRNESFYAATGEPLKTVDYTYKVYPEVDIFQEDTPYTLYTNTPKRQKLTMIGNYTQVNKVFYYQYNLVRKQITDYVASGENITTTEEYSYNATGEYLTEKKSFNSDGSTLTTRYSYLQEGLGTAPLFMPSYSLLGSTAYYHNNTLLYSVNNDYREETNVFTAGGRSYAPIRKMVLGSTSTLYPNSTGKVIAYLKHDDYGNPMYVSENDIFNNVYLWTQGGNRLACKIDNATYEAVMAGLGVDIKTDPLASSGQWNDYERIESLRTGIPGALVQTAYHNSYGLQDKIIDPQGRTTQFDYYKDHKLKEVYIMNNGVKEILESYEYHIINGN